jgi:hypothetical protein
MKTLFSILISIFTLLFPVMLFSEPEAAQETAEAASSIDWANFPWAEVITGLAGLILTIIGYFTGKKIERKKQDY